MTKVTGVGTASFTYSQPRGSYKNVGRLTTVASPGTSLQMDHDAMGRTMRQSRTIDSTTYVMGTSYDTAGQPTLITYPDGTSLGPITLVTTTPARPEPVQSLTYDNYDNVGLLGRVTSGASGGESWTYDYDGGYRLTSAANLSNRNDSQYFGYDLIGRMTTNSRVGTYTYPGVGSPRPHAPVTAGPNS